MYTVYLDDNLIYHPNADDLAILDPVLTLELNTAGSFVFTMPATHPYYDSTILMLSRVDVYRDDELMFRGRITDQTVDFWKRKKVTCEGELAYLNDSIQPAAEYHDMTVRSYLQTLISIHNDQVEDAKKFTVGIVTVTDSNDSLYRYTNFNSTMEEIKEDLVDDLGGYLRVRNQGGVRYLDYVTLDDYGNTNDQAIRFGINLLDFTQDMDVTDIATVVIPLGERLEESPIPALDMRLTIEDVNSGKNYVQSDEGVATYGRITKTVVWDDVTVASNLLARGKQYLSDTQWDDVKLTATAVDMSLTDAETDAFSLGDQLRVVSTPHGLDRYFPLSKMELYLLEPQRNTYTLGITVSASLIGTLITQNDLTSQLGSLSAKTSSRTADAIESASSEVLAEAKDVATQLITSATASGHVVLESPYEEILIMDTDDKSTAKRVWRWNLNGLGYSSTGYNGTYGTAITMDGAIVADYITTGTMYADRIKGGTLTLGGSSNTYGAMSILNSSGTEVGSWNRNGITAISGTIAGWTIGSSAIYNGTSSTTSTTKGTYIGTAGFRQYYSSSKYINMIDGVLEAYGATISGTVTASSGKIGGWILASGKIYNDLDNYGKTAAVQAPSSSNTWVFAAGGSSHSSYADCPFRVSKDGVLYATDAHITGAVTATSGTIGGWTIGSSSLYNGTTSMSSTTNGIFIGTGGYRQYNSGAYLNITSSTLENGTSSGSYSKLTSAMLQLAQEGTLVGSFGTNAWASVSGTKGVNIHLEYACDFISFSHKESSSASTYTAAYYISYNSAISSYRHNFSGSIYSNGDLYMHGYIYLNAYRMYVNDYGSYLGSLNSSEFGYGVYCYGPFSATGAVMVGNTTYGSQYMLHVHGSGYASGDWYNGSDLSLKTDVKCIEEKESDAMINALEPVTFRYKDDTRLHFGVTYQNVIEALKAAGIDPDDTAIVSTASENGGEEFGTVAYSELIGLLIYEIKKIKSDINELKKEAIL